MTRIPREGRTIQMILFGERLAVPQWCDLTEPTRAEVVRLLAQLLVSVQADSSESLPPSRGEHHE